MHSTKRVGKRGFSKPGLVFTLALVLLVVALGVAGCAPGGAAQSPAVTPESVTPTAQAGATPEPVVTGTATLTGTPTVPGPTPTGPAPDPASRLTIRNFYSPDDSLVKRDFLDLDGDSKSEVFFTISGNRVPITQEVQSRMAVLTYDDVYREWDLAWFSGPITGTAHPLPAANRSGAGGYNGGNILGIGGAILAARTTTTLDGRANLYLFRWDQASRKGVPLKMAGENGAERDAVFTADLDLNLADIDDDGIYEVVADNVSGVQIWRWDRAANRFVQEVAR